MGSIRTASYVILGVFIVSFATTFGSFLLKNLFAVSNPLLSEGTSTLVVGTTSSDTASTTTASPAIGLLHVPKLPEARPPQGGVSLPIAPVITPPPVAATSTFIYSFNAAGILEEADTEAHSRSPYWFLDSGGELVIHDGIGETVQGDLPALDYWRLEYADTNPSDTDNGFHPQNIFRLVSKNAWENATVESWFKIARDSLSTSANRTGSNGLLLMSHYRDSETLYYAGIRVDGTAVIKKKYHGTYYTLAQTPIFPGIYHKTSNPNLLPHEAWLGLRVTTKTESDGSVVIELSVRSETNPSWSIVATAHDRGAGGVPPITGPGSVGIRTDFMDVAFKNFRVENL